MSAGFAALEDAIQRASSSAKRMAQAAKNSISSSTKYRAQQRAAAAEAEQRVQALLDHYAAVTALREAALQAAKFLDGVGRNDRARPLRDAAHRVAGPLESQAAGAASQMPPAGWVSVDDHLPANGQHVEVIARSVRQGGARSTLWVLNNSDVTHWRAIRGGV